MSAAAARKRVDDARAAAGVLPYVGPRLKDAAALMQTELTPVRYAVPGWVPEGLMGVVAPPKFGKSTLLLQMCVACASGGEFWGEAVPQSKALMIDLETNERRLRRKLEAAGALTLKPGHLLYATEWPRGLLGVEAIARALDDDPEIKLVVVDTLQRFRDPGVSGKNAYAADYDELAPLQQLCRDRAGLAIVIVHHTRKAASDDPIASVNGSSGITGVLDGMWILGRRGAEYTLHVRARDWERDEDEFTLLRAGGGWELTHAPQLLHTEKELLSRLDVLGGTASTAALAEALSISRQAALKRLNRMQDRGLVQFREGVWHALR